MKNLRYSLLALIPIFLLATSCPLLNVWSENHDSVSNAPPKVTPCVVLTGERAYPPTITARPKETARPGDTLTITFASGYDMVLPKCEKRNGKEYYQYPTLKELAERTRMTIVQLDSKDFTSVRCGYECEVSFTFPADIQAGKHTITLLPGGWHFDPRETTFAISVTEP